MTNVNPTSPELKASQEANTEPATETKKPKAGRHVRTAWPHSKFTIDKNTEITSEWTHVEQGDLDKVRQAAEEHGVPLEEKGVTEPEAAPHAPPIA
jgi:hypothetical protein